MKIDYFAEYIGLFIQYIILLVENKIAIVSNVKHAHCNTQTQNQIFNAILYLPICFRNFD